jgi:Zn-dependent protease with chaperone function
MDFFEAQDRAKQNTWKLILLYALAVFGIILSVYLVTLILFHSQVSVEGGVSLWYPGWLMTVSVMVMIMIGIGTVYRVSQLRKGGSAVAELLGGRRVNPSTTEHTERRLMNIVEEMSIASGLPVPDVYVLDKEENINAFAAGFGTNDAAVGVTRGALEQLNRDELQGVIAHEFSHIFNGDMRLNIRLIGILNGILVIHIMGMILMRSTFYSGAMRGGRGGRSGGNSAMAMILFGLALVIIGYIGMLFGRMIQSAISRQREYLADAAAVQYTRNPDGLAGALNKIGMKKKGAEIKDGHAMEMSHLFFASSFHSALDKMFATHPPIEDRIKAIAPSYGYGEKKDGAKIREKFRKDHVAGGTTGSAGGVKGHAALTPEVILAAIGTLGGQNVSRAGQLLREIPVSLREAAHEPMAAEALVYGLFFASGNGKAPQKSLPEWFVEKAGDEMAAEVEKLLTELKSAKREWYLPLAELALPSLRHMSKTQYKTFREIIEQMILKTDSENLFGFALEKMVIHQLDNAFSKVKKPDVRHHNLKSLEKELSVLLSALSHASATDTGEAWDAGIKPIEKVMPDGLKLLPKAECGINQLDTALDELAASANPVKKYIISAVIHCITSDKQITTKEKELTRAISEALDSPIPLGAMG